MIYTIKLDVFFDDDEILSEEKLKEGIKECLDSGNVKICDFKLLYVND